ncbi:hypothetical protein MRX96_043915 [Rhipicephalus microplus]
MRTSWVLFFAVVFTLCKCWRYVPLASIVAECIGFIVVVSSLSYWLARYIWTVAFVSLVSGEGKAVLVTGCDSGFGYYLVKSLSRIGFFVFAGCLDANSDGANDLRTLDNVKVLQMDISSEEQVNDAVATIKEGLGSKVLWAVVCNAGIRNEGLLEWIPMDALKRVIDVNIIGNCRVSYVTMPMATPYSMTKHALVSMVDGLRRECYGKGVDIISVMPQAYKSCLAESPCACCSSPTPENSLALQKFR